MRILAPVLGVLLLHISLRAQAPSGGSPVSPPVRVSGFTMARQLIQHIDPAFPSNARTHPAGTEVEVYALIGKDGLVEEADALSGPADLGRSAVDAAKKYVYRPYLVNGSPIAVQTTITVAFSGAATLTVPTAGTLALSTHPVTPPDLKIPGSAMPPALAAAKAQPTEATRQPVTSAVSQTQPALRLAATPSVPIRSTTASAPGATAFVQAQRVNPAVQPLASVVRTSSFIHTPRTLIQKVPPVYPSEAEAKEIEGSVVVDYTITPGGTTRHIVAGSGPPELRQAAIDAVSQWKYTPVPAIDDEPMATAVLFALEGSAKVPPEVMAGMIDEHEIPVYPPTALAAGIHGTVKMHALIGRQGQVERLDFVSGPDALRESAMDAVRLWRYRPYLRNGVDVEVDTSIFVDFSLPDEAHLQ